LCVNEIEISYGGLNKFTKFNKMQVVSTESAWEIPKPPSKPPAPSGELAKVADKVIPPEPDKTDLQLMVEDTKKIDVSVASTFFDGKCLNQQIQKEIVEVSDCKSPFSSLYDKFSYNKDLKRDLFPTIQYIYVRCPKNCYGSDAQVKGLIIHDTDSSICMSALADRAIDHTGGVISVMMTKAQNFWNEQFSVANGVPVGLGGTKSNVAFVVGKVDGPNFTASKIRIIDFEGKISSKGRLEIKIEKLWSTIKLYDGGIKEDDGTELNRDLIRQNIAYSACKELGYEYGIMIGSGPNVNSAGNLINQVEL